MSNNNPNNNSNNINNLRNNSNNSNNNNNKESTLFVIIRLPIKRPDNFIDPPCTLWNETKEQLLWEYLNHNKGRNIDWNYLSQELQIPTPYLIKFSSFLYEVQLLKLRNQTWPTPKDIINFESDTDNNEELSEVQEDNYNERDNIEEEEREVISNINLLQTKLLEEPHLNTTETQRSTPFVTPLSSPMNRSRELINPNKLSTKTSPTISNQQEKQTNIISSLPTLSKDTISGQLSEKLSKINLNLISDENKGIGLKFGDNKDDMDNFRFGKSLSELNITASSNNNNNQLQESNNEEENDTNSIGSPYSDLSDESVTQSQLEDAFLSKFKNYSIFRKSHFY